MAQKKNHIRGFFRHLAQISARGAGNIASIIPSIPASIEQSQYGYLAAGVTVGFVSAFIEEIFKIRQEKLDKKQQSELKQFFTDIKKELGEQEGNLAELLVARSVHYDSLKFIQTEIKQISDLLKDPEHAEVPEIIEQAGNNIIPQIQGIIDKQTEELKSHTTSEHQEQLNEIRLIIQEEFLKYFQLDNKKPSEDGKIHNLPYNSLGNLFKGREDDFNKLVEHIESESQVTAITQDKDMSIKAIHGLGGIGKTRLACP